MSAEEVSFISLFEAARRAENLPAMRHDLVAREIGRQATHGADPYLRTFFTVWHDELNHTEEIARLTQNATDILYLRQERAEDEVLPSSSVVNYLHKSYQALEQADNDNYPSGYDDPKTVRRSLQPLVEHEERQEAFLGHFLWPMSTNDPERGKVFKAAARACGKTGPLSILDGGCSTNHMLKKQVLSDMGQLEFSRTQVCYWDPRQEKMVGSAPHTRRFNRVVREEPLGVSGGVGVDFINYPADPGARARARSHRFRPGELVMDAKTTEFDTLNTTDVPDVYFAFDDLTSPAFFWDRKAKRHYAGNHFDIANLSFMLYDRTQEERQTILLNVQNQLKDDGILVVIDAVDLDESGELVFPDAWEPWSFSTLVWDGDRWQKLFRMDSGRVKRITLEPALGELAAARELGLTPVTLTAT
jgi:hypothetical protein